MRCIPKHRWVVRAKAAHRAILVVHGTKPVVGALQKGKTIAKSNAGICLDKLRLAKIIISGEFGKGCHINAIVIVVTCDIAVLVIGGKVYIAFIETYTGASNDIPVLD